MSTQALNVARVSAPSGIVIIDTLELLHSSFPAPIRLTNQRQDFTATLEDSAPADAGETVTFTHAAFELTLPKSGASGIQQLNIILGNVDKSVSEHMEEVVQSGGAITAIYRPYLSNDTSGPAIDPPPRLTLATAVADYWTVNATAKTIDWINRKVHSRIYNLDEFPGLRTS